MAGPAFDNWVLNLGLKQVHDPAFEKPVFRNARNGQVLLADQLDEKIGLSLRVHRIKQNLSVEKVPKLLGLTQSVSMRYENAIPRLTCPSSRAAAICSSNSSTRGMNVVP